MYFYFTLCRYLSHQGHLKNIKKTHYNLWNIRYVWKTEFKTLNARRTKTTNCIKYPKQITSFIITYVTLRFKRINTISYKNEGNIKVGKIENREGNNNKIE